MANTNEAIERSAWLIANMLIMPRYELWIQREVSIERAAATTRIEGATLNADEVGQLAKKRPVGKPTEDELANLNALEAYRFVDYLSDQPDVPLDELVIRELNRYFLNGMDEMLTPGVYRKGQNKVGDKYLPPDQGDVPDLIHAFAAWLRAKDDDLHPVVKAGIAHIQFIAIHPFWDGNGRTARALATVILQRSRFNFRKLVSLERFFEGNKRDYISAIESTLGDSYAPDYDASSWLEFFSSSLLAEGMRITDRLTQWHQTVAVLYEAMEPLNVNRRQTDGMALAVRTGRLTRAEYMEMTGASPLTASRDLARLVDLGVLIPKGKTRGRVYLFDHDWLLEKRKDRKKADEKPKQASLFDN
ncbi:MAG: Fic family protein [Chloroflexi bacterium]|nr:Fic family protein [Chloroflexota bacterium]